MRSVTSDRAGLLAGISGFVVAEDQSLQARARRTFERGRALAAGGAETVQGRLRTLYRLPSRPGPEASEPASEPVASAQPAESAPTEAASPLSATVSPAVSLRITLAAAIIRVSQIAADLKERLRPSERFRDGLAVAALASRWLARQLWRLPRGAKIAAGLALGLYLAPWPSWDGGAPQDQASVAPVVTPAQAREVADGWRPIAAPIPTYHLEAPELDRMQPKYRARRQASGARQDILVFGDLQAEAVPGQRPRPAGAVMIEVYPAGTPESSSMFVDAARRASVVGASVERVGAATPLLTKFGAFDAADATLATDRGQRGCLVFRHAAEPVPLQIHGWFCGTPTRPVDRSMLACVLDRVDLVSAGDDAALKAYFASVERERKSCGGYRPSSAKVSWMDPAGQAPPLKTTFSEPARRKPAAAGN